MEITSDLINLKLEQINYLIDLVSKDIETEKTAYTFAYNPYERKGLPTKKQCQDHNAQSMQQHAVIRQLYILSQYSVETTQQYSPEQFGKPGSETKPDLCDEKGRPLAWVIA